MRLLGFVGFLLVLVIIAGIVAGNGIAIIFGILFLIITIAWSRKSKGRESAHTYDHVGEYAHPDERGRLEEIYSWFDRPYSRQPRNMTAKIYVDTSVWLRLFEERVTQYNIEEQAAAERIFKDHLDSIIPSKFQHKQLLDKEKKPETLEKRLLYRRTREAYERRWPNLKEDRAYRDMANTLCQIADMDDWEDAVHIVIACNERAKYFVTADWELYSNRSKISAKRPIIGKKKVIEDALKSMNFGSLRILNPVDF